MPNPIAPFSDHLIGAIKRFFHCPTGGIVTRHLLGHGMETQDQALDALQESVMQLPRNARTLAYTLFQADIELQRLLTQAVVVSRQHEKQTHRPRSCPAQPRTPQTRVAMWIGPGSDSSARMSATVRP